MPYTWTFFTWEDDTFDEPEDAIDRYEMVTGDILTLHEQTVVQTATRRWRVEEDGRLTPLPN